jgi:hypothetical protein
VKKRKRNLYFGFGPASKKERKKALTLYRRPKQTPISHGRQRRGDGSWGDKTLSGARAEVASALLNQGYKEPQARKMAASAKGSDFGSLFRDAIKRNPRVFPAISESQIQALRKLVRTKHMAKKRKTRKKKNSRKGKMPPGLRKYWAKKRAKKNSRRRKAKRTTRRPRVRRRRKPVSMRVKNFRRAARKPKARRRRRKANPRRRITRITAPSGLGPKGLRQFRSLVARITGKRTRIVSR